MPSSPERVAPAESPPRDSGASWRAWNRRLHFYLGLYFLFFVWLFALSGLLLNHNAWSFAEFWPNRKVTVSERAIQPPPAGTMLDGAQDIMRQLGLAGEIQWAATTREPARLQFLVSRPGLAFDVKADLRNARATVQRTEVNPWGTLRALHTFTGVRIGDTQNRRDWILTTAWALSMDAVAAGLVVMVLSGLVMWWGLPAKRAWGLVAVVAGVLVCGWLVAGLRFGSA